MLAQASLPPGAVEANLTTSTSLPARPHASQSLLSLAQDLLEGGGVGRRLGVGGGWRGSALAGRQLIARCVLVDKQVGRVGHLLGDRRQARQLGDFFVRPF
jgi:hypothetical protein